MTLVLAPKAANLIIWIDALCGKQMNLQHKYKIYILAALIDVRNLYLKHLKRLVFQMVIKSKYLH